MSTLSALTAREVYQLLKDVALGVSTLRVITLTYSTEPDTQLIGVAIDDCQAQLLCMHRQLVRCERFVAPDGRFWALEDGQRFGTNPVDFLSQWEHQQLTRLLEVP